MPANNSPFGATLASFHLTGIANGPDSASNQLGKGFSVPSISLKVAPDAWPSTTPEFSRGSAKPTSAGVSNEPISPEWISRHKTL
ncbi:unannotated protein [freshwater metagenome]|uniref:Unannotated protein n=1 Tax=freshwater metagenome TaxID=449393 RepID=A0A6J7Q922_9ZZZZ